MSSGETQGGSVKASRKAAGAAADTTAAAPLNMATAAPSTAQSSSNTYNTAASDDVSSGTALLNAVVADTVSPNMTYAMGPSSEAPIGSIEVTDLKQDSSFVAPPAYLASPLFIIFSDMGVIFSQLPYLPNVFLPLNLDRYGLLEDMTIGGLIYQIAAVIVTLVVLAIAAASLVAGFPWPILVILGTVTLIQLMYLIQGNETIIDIPDEDDYKRFRHEQWFFINGIATTTSGHKKALTRLESIFKRPIIGINNKSLGVIADLLECLVQRDLRWPTDDIRSGYNVVKTAVLNPYKTRIVICAHSQGCIIASEIADQLLSDFSSKELRRVEFYTFAAAANHFSAPLDVNSRSPWAHLEHFAHDKDMVSRFGVLHFSDVNQVVRRTRVNKAGDRSGSSSAPRDVNAPPPPTTTSRFAGRIFVQKASGHMLCSHYLGKHNILDSKAAREHSQLSKYRDGALPAPAPAR